MIGTTDLNTLEFTDDGLAGDSLIQYKIRAVTEAGPGEFSIRNTFITASVPETPQVPALLS